MKLYLGDAVTVQERNRKRPPEGSSVISEMGTASLKCSLQDGTQVFLEIINQRYECSSCTGKSLASIRDMAIH